MATQITNHKCPSCGAPLHYSSATGRLECDYCGSSFTVAEVEAMFAAKEQAAAAAFSQEMDRSVQWDTSGLSEDWGAEGAGMRAYSCPSCGAELICDSTTAATACPYCGNPTVVPGQFTGALRPDYVIPFKLDRAAALAALKKHYKGKPFLPKAFTTGNHVEKIQGIYVPFWLFDADTAGTCLFDGTKSYTVGVGKKKVTITKHYDVRRSGMVRFEKVPTDASSKMDDDLMDSVGPFQYEGLQPFSTAYLPGYLADRYDVTVEDCSQRMEEMCIASTENAFKNDAEGYGSFTTKEKDIKVTHGKVYYALMPVWYLNTRWNGKDYVFAMNGQTGKLVGDLPVDKGKYFGFMFGLTAILTAILYIFMSM